MNREHYIKLLKEFILTNPKRPFEEVKEIVTEVGASEEELKQAIKEASAELSANAPQNLYSELQTNQPEEQSEEPQKKHFVPTGTMIATSIALITVLLTALLLYLYGPLRNSTTNDQANTQQPSQTTQNNGIPVVYASQKKLNAQEIFSFPQTEVTLQYSGRPKKEVFGFFPYWMLDTADQISLDALTTIALFGLTVNSDGNVVTVIDGKEEEGWLTWNDKRLDQFITKAKTNNIDVALVLKSFNNADIESLSTSDDAQRTFIANAVQLVSLKSLDGINIDFEYHGTPDENVTFGFTRLVANLNAELKRQIPNAKLTVDAYLKSAAEDDLIDVASIANHVDAIVVMGYDVHTTQGGPGPIAPFEGESSIVGFLQSYLTRVDPQKIILALPYYAYDWPTTGNQPASIKSYAEVASPENQRPVLWDDVAQTPYYTYQDSSGAVRIVHFENARSLGIKYDYVNQNNLQGIGIWALGYDGKANDLEQLIFNKFAQ